jgi:tetratricopeptide (TPR) repeat protein
MLFKEWKELVPQPRPLENGDKWNIFLSYRSINRAWVLNLYDVLGEAGHKVFLDQYQLKPGDLLSPGLLDALNKSQCGILIWSSLSDSKWLEKEYLTMERLEENKLGFIFIPLKLDKAELPGFANLKIHLNFSSYPDGPNGGDLLRLLFGVTGQPLSSEAVKFANKIDEESKRESNKIEAAIDLGNPELLIELQARGEIAWKINSILGCKTSEGLIKLKKYDEAIEILDKLSNEFPKAIRPKQLHALALTRKKNIGDLKKAQNILAQLYAAGERDPETLGILGSTWMKRYDISKDQRELTKSRNLYAEAFEKTPYDYYTGINAASKSIFLNTKEDFKKGQDYADRVQKIVGKSEYHNDYWKTATVAEVFLIKKEYDKAAEMYKKAVEMAPTETGSHEVTLDQAQKLMEVLSPNEADTNKIINAFK